MSSNLFAAWPKGVEDDLAAGRTNGCVGSVLLSETAKVLVWQLYIPTVRTLALASGQHPHEDPSLLRHDVNNNDAGLTQFGRRAARKAPQRYEVGRAFSS